MLIPHGSLGKTCCSPGLLSTQAATVCLLTLRDNTGCNCLPADPQGQHRLQLSAFRPSGTMHLLFSLLTASQARKGLALRMQTHIRAHIKSHRHTDTHIHAVKFQNCGLQNGANKTIRLFFLKEVVSPRTPGAGQTQYTAQEDTELPIFLPLRPLKHEDCGYVPLP